METEKIYDGIDFMGESPAKVNLKILIITSLAAIGVGALTWYFFKKDSSKCSQDFSQQSSL